MNIISRAHDGHATEATPPAEPLADLEEQYAQNELDHDRLPTEAGFRAWLARRGGYVRRTPDPIDVLVLLAAGLDPTPAELDAAGVTRVDQVPVSGVGRG